MTNKGSTTELERGVQEALARLDPQERREYDLALATFPDLVQRESPVDDFLWTEDYNTERAALRLARYWKARRYAFGEDRWLLPLDQTGHGALGEEEIHLLRSGYFVVIVRPGGGVVTLIDRSRLSHTVGVLPGIRLSFYLTALHAKDARQGYVRLHVERGLPQPPPKISKDLFAIFNVAMPLRMWQCRSFVVQACFEAGKEVLVDYMVHQTKETMNFNSGQRPVEVVGHSMRQTRQVLQLTSGLEDDCLPVCLGGDFDYSLYGDWIRQRLSVEGGQRSIIPSVGLRLEGVSAASATNEEDEKSEMCRTLRDAPLGLTFQEERGQSAAHLRLPPYNERVPISTSKVFLSHN